MIRIDATTIMYRGEPYIHVEKVDALTEEELPESYLKESLCDCFLTKVVGDLVSMLAICHKVQPLKDFSIPEAREDYMAMERSRTTHRTCAIYNNAIHYMIAEGRRYRADDFYHFEWLAKEAASNLQAINRKIKGIEKKWLAHPDISIKI